MRLRFFSTMTFASSSSWYVVAVGGRQMKLSRSKHAMARSSSSASKRCLSVRLSFERFTLIRFGWKGGEEGGRVSRARPSRPSQERIPVACRHRVACASSPPCNHRGSSRRPTFCRTRGYRRESDRTRNEMGAPAATALIPFLHRRPYHRSADCGRARRKYHTALF